jgi:hypothetical protein
MPAGVQVPLTSEADGPVDGAAVHGTLDGALPLGLGVALGAGEGGLGGGAEIDGETSAVLGGARLAEGPGGPGEATQETRPRSDAAATMASSR